MACQQGPKSEEASKTYETERGVKQVQGRGEGGGIEALIRAEKSRIAE